MAPLTAALIALLSLQSELETLLEQLKADATREAASKRLADLAFEKDLRQELQARASAFEGPAAAAVKRAAAVARYRWALDDETARLLNDGLGFADFADAFANGTPERRRFLIIHLSTFTEPSLLPMLKIWEQEVDEANRPLLTLVRGLCGDASVTGDLLELLKLEPAYARSAAAALHRVLTKEQLPRLRGLLANPKAASHAWQLIERLDPESLREEAARLLKEGGEEMRFYAALTLAKLGDRTGLAVLAAALAKETNPRGRRFLVETMAKLKPVEAQGTFEAMARHPDPDTVLLGLEGLLSIDVEAAIQPLLEALAHSDQSRVASFASAQLEKIDEGWWIGPARAMLKAKSREKRANGAYLIGTTRKEKHIDALVPLLQDPEGYVQYRALEALHRLSPARAAKEAPALLEAKDGFVRTLAAEIVTTAEPARAEAVYRAQLAAPAPYPRVAALQKLTTLGVKDAEEIARTFIADPSSALRLHGLSVLLQRGSPDGLDRLFESFAGLGEQASYAWVLLERHATDPALAPRFAKELLSAGAPLNNRLLAAAWLALYGGDASVETFERAIGDAAPPIRLSAAVGLARAGRHDSARPALLGLLENPEVRLSPDLYHALALCGGAEVAAALGQAARSAKPQEFAAIVLATESLGRLRSDAGRAAAHKAIFSEHPRLRDAGLFAAAKLGSGMARGRLLRRIGEIISAPEELHPVWLGELLGYAAELGGAEALELLRKTLTDGPVSLRARTVRLLGQNVSREGIELLRESLNDASTIEGVSELENGVREVALHTLLWATRTRFAGALEDRIRAWESWWEAEGRKSWK